jgi:hypothetical protein
MHLRREYRQIALKEARSCYDYIDDYLYKHPTGMQWVTGVGYINLWEILHRVEEALIKVEPPEMVLRGALHDKLAIQNSTIGNRDELLNKLVRAVSDIEPAGAVYLRDSQQEQHGEVLHQLVDAINQLEEVEPKIVWDGGESRKNQDAYEAVASMNYGLAQARLIATPLLIVALLIKECRVRWETSFVLMNPVIC